MQVEYKDVGEVQRKKVIGDYNLILLGQDYAINPNTKYILPEV